MFRKIICINAVLVILLAGFFYIFPPIRAALSMQDPAIKGPGVPTVAWRLSQQLAPRYARWAQERIANGKAATLSTRNISGTEWPIFGSVFYLWGIENLQNAWDRGDHGSTVEPRIYAKESIIAASELVIDPRHATWVIKHWGTNYMHRENLFYRALVISALTSRETLLHDKAHRDLLRKQVDSLAMEIDASRTGLLEDYPGECYPGDVMAALMIIKHADAVIGTNHSKMLQRALRAFTGKNQSRHGLPPFRVQALTGMALEEDRGSGNSYICLTGPELWPAQARQWYDRYDHFFWQSRMAAVGFREYTRDIPRTDWMCADVDAGPVIAGHGISACAFGVGASRKNGRFDRAYPLTTEMLATMWELPNGVLAIPRILSNLSDAPLLGEAAILWQLTTQPQKGFPVRTGGSVPAYVFILLGSIFLFGLWRIGEALMTISTMVKGPEPEVHRPRLQIWIWTLCLLGAVGSFVAGYSLASLAFLVLAVMLPAKKRAGAEYVVWHPKFQRALVMGCLIGGILALLSQYMLPGLGLLLLALILPVKRRKATTPITVTSISNYEPRKP